MKKRTPWQIQKAVYFALFLREVKTRFGGRSLGAFWLLLEPVAHLAIMMLIFGYIRHRVLPGLEFPVFLLSGVVPFFMFRSIALRVMDGVDGNRGLFGYRQVKPFDTLMTRAALEVSLYGTVYLILLVALGWLGFHPLPSAPLEVFAIFALMIVMGFAMGLVFAIATDDLPQLRSFVRIMFLPLYLMSGVIFPIASIPFEARKWFIWNPVLHAIETLRGYYFTQYHLIVEIDVTYPLAFTLVTLVFGMALYRVRRDRLVAS